MGGVFFFLIMIVIVVGLIFLSIKVNNAKYRAKQTILNKAGIGQANVNSMTDDIMEKGKVKKFLENHPAYTEESLKQHIKDIAQEIANQNLTHPAEDKVLEKLANDKKVAKYSNMQIVGCSLVGYVEKYGYLTAKVTFSDNRDQYMMFVYFQLSGDEFKVTKYQMQKGAAIGF